MTGFKLMAFLLFDEAVRWLDARVGQVVAVTVQPRGSNSRGFFEGELREGTSRWLLVNASSGDPSSLHTWDVGDDSAFMFLAEEFINAIEDQSNLTIDLNGAHIVVQATAGFQRN